MTSNPLISGILCTGLYRKIKPFRTKQDIRPVGIYIPILTSMLYIVRYLTVPRYSVLNEYKQCTFILEYDTQDALWVRVMHSIIYSALRILNIGRFEISTVEGVNKRPLTHLLCLGCFSRSAIHGRGLYCKRNIDAGEMIIEYSGNVVRSVLTDKREKYYDEKVRT